MNFKTWLFDLDGTLADTAPDLTQALNHVLKLKGKPEIDEKTVRPYAAFGSRYLIKLGFGENHPEADSLKSELLDYYAANVAVHTQLFVGMNKVLDALDDNNVNWGVVTNKPERFTLPLLCALDLDSRAKIIVSGDTCKKSKPDPEPVLYACARLKARPQNSIYIGDSHVDLKATKNAGIRMILAEYGYLHENDKPDTWELFARVNRADELLKYI